MAKTLTGDPTLVDPGFDTPTKNPLYLLQKWLDEADNLNIAEPRGMVLSTVDSRCHPSSRVVLLKECDETGIIFTTSSTSTKGKDLELNPFAAGNLWWRETMQQVCFRGRVNQLSDDKSDEIFQERTREAQAVASVSHQSAPLLNESVLRDKICALINTKGPIERPEGWNAYHIAVESIEFWHGSNDRFHKRLRYDLINGQWEHQRLQP